MLRILPTYSDRHGMTKSAYPDQTPRDAASDQGLHSLLFIKRLLDTITDRETVLFKF